MLGSGVLRVLLLVVAVLLVGSPVVASEPSPSPDVLYPDDPDLQRVYELGFSDGAADGRSNGYDEGFADGQEQGEATGRDESDLQDQVQGEAESSPPTTEPTSSPTPTVQADDPVTPQVVERTEPGFPWWPLAFALVASVWFITRRRRPDRE